MDQDLKTQWLTALRSGEYKQAKGVLTKSFEGEKYYCCLGVLCDIYYADKQEAVGPADGEFNRDLLAYDGATGSLPPALMHELGESAAVRLPHPIENENDSAVPFVSLVELNDVGGYTFEQIADVIEEQF